jgi:hypothetical protein
MKYCDNQWCECPATQTVKVSINKPHDGKRRYCDSCYEVYMIGVQHGRHHEAAVHGVQVGQDSSQDKPKRQLPAGRKKE